MASAVDEGENINPEVYELSLGLLKESTDDKQYMEAVDTIFKIFNNVVKHADEEKYRRLPKTNKTFQKKVWQHDGAQQLMFAAGWVEVDDCVFLPGEVQIAPVVEILEQQHRLLHPPVSLPRESEEDIKKREAIEKEKKLYLEKVRRDKEERKRIRDQIQSDRKDANARESQSSHAAKNLTKDGHMTTFGDIGVDLTKGGGG